MTNWKESNLVCKDHFTSTMVPHVDEYLALDAKSAKQQENTVLLAPLVVSTAVTGAAMFELIFSNCVFYCCLGT